VTLEAVILGCGSSGGVPRADGAWGACDPKEPKNRRSRCSLLVRRRGPGGVTNVLVDTAPELRQQTAGAGVNHVDAVLYSHDHADQAHGIDDLRAFFLSARRRIPCFMDGPTRRTLERRFDYIFQGEGFYPAIADLHDMPANGEAWRIDGAGGPIDVTAFDQDHGGVRSLGFRFGPIAYSSDVVDIPDESFALLAGVDTWIVDALRWTPHPTHAHVGRALEWIARVQPRRAVLTNLHIDLDYGRLAAELPQGVEPAYDGMILTPESPQRDFR
jgi:phosphoribosyl 1,2-cyclic phosphate phosphodiesterase